MRQPYHKNSEPGQPGLLPREISRRAFLSDDLSEKASHIRKPGQWQQTAPGVLSQATTLPGLPCSYPSDKLYVHRSCILAQSHPKGGSGFPYSTPVFHFQDIAVKSPQKESHRTFQGCSAIRISLPGSDHLLFPHCCEEKGSTDSFHHWSHTLSGHMPGILCSASF